MTQTEALLTIHVQFATISLLLNLIHYRTRNGNFANIIP